jgi:hypothetical protein
MALNWYMTWLPMHVLDCWQLSVNRTTFSFYT